MNIDYFRVTGLHGYKNYDIRFRDNTVIIVGENGVGKTTVLRLLFYILSGQLGLIPQYKFNKISISINSKEYVIEYKELIEKMKKVDERMLQRLPPGVRERFSEALDNSGGSLFLTDYESILDEYNIPARYIFKQRDLFEQYEFEGLNEIEQSISEIRSELTSQIIYLPTYRRIEQELGNIIRNLDKEEWRERNIRRKSKNDNAFIELIEFGMKDVDESIKTTVEELKEFARESLNTLTLKYLGDVVDKEYDKVDIEEIKNTPEENIHSVLDRIQESILSISHKEHLFRRINEVRGGASLDEHAKVICHYFLKLLQFQQKLRKKEEEIVKFCNVCNSYMEDKVFSYDSTNFNFTIVSTTDDKRKIEMKHLSSGEKQIVSLFSHLFLSKESSFFVLIDEPELSLSVPWQRKFLIDIRNSTLCTGIVAVTHSPFIYDNELEIFAHGLGEFEV